MRLALLLAALLLAAVPATAQTYREFTARLDARETDLDYLAFRLAYADSDGYAPYDTDTSDQRRRMLRAFFQTDDLPLALAIADSALARNLTDIDSHFISMVASRALGDSLRADFHEAVGMGLITSIRDSGDGTIPASPCRVISVDEEYALLRYYGLRSTGQAMETCNGERCDHLTVEDPDEAEDAPTDLYFDVSIPFAYMQRQTRR